MQFHSIFLRIHRFMCASSVAAVCFVFLPYRWTNEVKWRTTFVVQRCTGNTNQFSNQFGQPIGGEWVAETISIVSESICSIIYIQSIRCCCLEQHMCTPLRVCLRFRFDFSLSFCIFHMRRTHPQRQLNCLANASITCNMFADIQGRTHQFYADDECKYSRVSSDALTYKRPAAIRMPGANSSTTHNCVA